MTKKPLKKSLFLKLAGIYSFLGVFLFTINNMISFSNHLHLVFSWITGGYFVISAGLFFAFFYSLFYDSTPLLSWLTDFTQELDSIISSITGTNTGLITESEQKKTNETQSIETQQPIPTNIKFNNELDEKHLLILEKITILKSNQLFSDYLHDINSIENKILPSILSIYFEMPPELLTEKIIQNTRQQFNLIFEQLLQIEKNVISCIEHKSNAMTRFLEAKK